MIQPIANQLRYLRGDKYYRIYNEFKRKSWIYSLIGVGSATLVFNNKNKLLLNLRSDANTCGILGGSKELRETLEECAIRELKKETNINVNDLELITVLSGKE